MSCTHQRRCSIGPIPPATCRQLHDFGARLGVRTADDKLGLTFYARNLFDKFNPSYRVGNLVAFATGDTHSYIQFLVPESRRVIGASLDVKF